MRGGESREADKDDLNAGHLESRHVRSQEWVLQISEGTDQKLFDEAVFCPPGS